MRELPILFNTSMIQAILREIDPKIATRRVIKEFIPDDAIWGYTDFTPKGCISCRGTFADGYREKFFKLPYQPGDLLYARETWSEIKNSDGSHKKYVYKASDTYPFEEKGYILKFRWYPSIHMPKKAARIWLKVTDIGVERLQDITEEQAKSEGAVDNRGFIHSPENEFNAIHSAREHFIIIWNPTIPKEQRDIYGWKANPWVWVIKFKRCYKPGEQMV